MTSKDGVNYVESLTYWEGIPPTVDGMLGGFGFISSVDIQGSEQFLKTLFQVRPLVIGQSLNIIYIQGLLWDLGLVHKLT